MTRDTFITDLTARFITTRLEVPLAAAGAVAVRTGGLGDAPRTGGLRVTPRAGEATPRSLQIVRSEIEGQYLNELALVPGSATTQLDVFVDVSPTRSIRVAVFNAGTAASNISLVLRTADGQALLALANVLTVTPSAQVVRSLEDFAVLPASFEGMLTVLASSPVVTSVLTAGGNLRPSTFLDPVLLAPFTIADRGVPASVSTQPLALTPDTTHQLALLNPGLTTLTGSFQLRSASGAPLTASDAGSSATSFSYSIPAGGYRVFRLTFAQPSGDLATAYASIAPSAGQLAPLVQLVEDRTVGASGAGALSLPRAMPPARGSRHLVMPVNTALRDSGFILTNVTAAAIAVTLRLRELGGAEFGSTVVNVPAGGQVLTLARSLFPSAGAAFSGTLETSSTNPVAGVGLLRSVSDRGDDIVAGVPAMDGDAATSSEPLLFPYAIDGDSYASEWWLQNAAAAAGRVRLAFTGEDGLTRYFPFR
jgi:hypothetical protein